MLLISTQEFCLYIHILTLQALEDVIENLDAWHNEKDEKLAPIKEARDLEKKTEIARQTAEYQAMPEPKDEFVADKIKIQEIEKKYESEIKLLENSFLSISTSRGLRMTCKSTIELAKYSLWDYQFQFVLTRKKNQDWLEVAKLF